MAARWGGSRSDVFRRLQLQAFRGWPLPGTRRRRVPGDRDLGGVLLVSAASTSATPAIAATATRSRSVENKKTGRLAMRSPLDQPCDASSSSRRRLRIGGDKLIGVRHLADIPADESVLALGSFCFSFWLWAGAGQRIPAAVGGTLGIWAAAWNGSATLQVINR